MRGSADGKSYQSLGSVFMRVRKHAVVGCPIPSIWGLCCAKKFGGMCSGMGSSSPVSTPTRRSGRIFWMEAIKLVLCWK